MKNIVIFTKLFFPANTPRSNRSTELAIELSRQGYNVTVYTIIRSYDYTKFEAKHNLIVKNYEKLIFSDFNSNTLSMNYSRLTKVLSFLFNKYTEFPDIELSYKVYKLLSGNKKKIDVLITIASPHTIHWGTALAVDKVKEFPKLWIADCGDPFMGNPNNYHPFYFKYIEKFFCKKVDYLTVPTQNSIPGYYNEFHNKIKVIPQGFNFDDYNYLPKYKQNNIPTFIYAGAFYENIRDPRPFLKYLASLDEDFKFIVYSRNKGLIKDYITQLGAKLEVKDYIPRKDVIKEFAKADFLINFENTEGVQTPSKLIDYKLSRRPILSIGSKEDIKKIDQFLKGNYELQSQSLLLDNYNITKVAKEFVNLFDKWKN